jgi:hypothetical protein
VSSIFDDRPERRALEVRIFEQRMEQFWKNWAPADKYKAARFQAELHAMVREIYREAQEPAMKQLASIISALPMPSMFLPKDR